MIRNILDHLEKLINTPSPTGFTQQATQLVSDFAKRHQIQHHITNKGAVVYTFIGENSATPRRMLAAHMDTLGAIIKSVDKLTAKIATVGGYPALYVVGDYCTIHTYSGEIVTGTILPDNPAVHVNNKLAEDKLTIEQLRIRLDLLPEQVSDTQHPVAPGNFVVLDPKLTHANGYVKCRHLDDKASAAILMNTAEWLLTHNEWKAVNSRIDIVFNVTEETGQGIAGFEQPPHELLVVDMGAIGEGLQGDEYSVSICVKDSSGPYHYALTHHLRELAQHYALPYQLDVFPFYSSDGSALLRAGHDTRVALIGPGVSASHGYERTHERSLEATAALVQAYLSSKTE